VGSIPTLKTWRALSSFFAGIRQYDSFIRIAHPDLECLAPEITRITHVFTKEATHGVYNGPVVPMSLTPPPRGGTMAKCRRHRDIRGAYHGRLPWCRAWPPKRRKKKVVRVSRAGFKWVLSETTGLSCTTVCSPAKCDPTGVQALNFTGALEAFPKGSCWGYGIEYGSDLPGITTGGICLGGGPSEFSCGGHHELTRRLCPCKEHVHDGF
jgi:hypothetical protein